MKIEAGDTGASGEHQRHLLYVAWGYPPSRGSGVYRAWATANAFAEAGWRVTVLTVPREIFEMSTGVDLTLEAQIHPSINIVRVPFHSGAFNNDLQDWSRFRAAAPEMWNMLQAKRGQKLFPERNYGDWRPILEAAAREIHAEAPVNLTIGTANPNVDFIPGHVLHRECGVPYVMDHRDAWSLDIYSGRRIVDVKSRAGQWERELVSNATEVWFVNRPIRDWHAEQYPEFAQRFVVVENGYDQVLDMPALPAEPRPPLVFGYIGTISVAIPMADLVEGWALARERSDIVRAARMNLHGYLNHLGAPGDNMIKAMAAFAANDIHYLGPVGRGEIAETYATFDALVLTFGAGRYITGGKVYEYASTGLPIVSVHDPVNETTRTLADYPGWHGTASVTPSAIADAFIATAEEAWNQTEDDRAAARSFATRFSRDAQLAPRISELRALVDHQTGVRTT